MGILKAIYKGEYRTEHFLTEEYEAAQRKNTELVETLLSSLAPEDLERLDASYADMANVENYENFLAGLRLGIAVMLECCQ